MRRPAILAFLLIAACSPPTPPAARVSPSPPQPAPAPVATDAPAGRYTLDKSHASLVFQVDHLGFSHYTAGFSRFGAVLDFDPANPAAMRVEATIDPASLVLPSPPEGFVETLLGPDWFAAGDFAAMTFRSTSVELTGPATARLVGEFTLRGVSAPVSLEVRFNGGYAGFPPYDPHARIGFSAHGTLDRSVFGMAAGIPPQGSTMGVSDAVNFAIEAEFAGPPTPESAQ